MGDLQFRPGQFIVLELSIDNKPRRSAFSIVRKEGKGFILGVKLRGAGGISAILNELTGPVKATMAGPFGAFALNPHCDQHIFVTGGSGITPVRSLLDTLFDSQNVPTIIYANASPEEAMYGASFRKLHERGYIRLVEVFDRKIKEALSSEANPDAAYYVCGPPGLVNATLGYLDNLHIPEARITTERYGLDMGQIADGPKDFYWQGWWRQKTKVTAHHGLSMLQAARHQGLAIPSACEVGVCGACEVHLKSGRVLCGMQEEGPGSNILSCISQPLDGPPPVIGPARRGRAEIVSLALIIGALSLGFWNFPPGSGWKAKGPMNTSHEGLECNACHKEAPGTMRQQLGHNARTLMGLHGHDWVAVGFAPVDNAACIDCHDRPDDRHPVSRFLEPRFAEQRANLSVHECNGCHGEHNGVRVANTGAEFCQQCHADMEVSFDPVTPSHAELLESDSWETCLQCHDFHGNHIAEVPLDLRDAIDTEAILRYLDGGPDPYSETKTSTAESTP